MKKWTPVKGVHFLRFLCGLGFYGHALSGVRVQRLDGAFAPRVLKFDMACRHEGCGGRLRRQYK